MTNRSEFRLNRKHPADGRSNRMEDANRTRREKESPSDAELQILCFCVKLPIDPSGQCDLFNNSLAE